MPLSAVLACWRCDARIAALRLTMSRAFVRSASITRTAKVWPINGFRSFTVCTSTSDAGMNARTPLTSSERPPLTVSVTVACRSPLSLAAPSAASQPRFCWAQRRLSVMRFLRSARASTAASTVSPTATTVVRSTCFSDDQWRSPTTPILPSPRSTSASRLATVRTVPVMISPLSKPPRFGGPRTTPASGNPSPASGSTSSTGSPSTEPGAGASSAAGASSGAGALAAGASSAAGAGSGAGDSAAGASSAAGAGSGAGVSAAGASAAGVGSVAASAAAATSSASVGSGVSEVVIRDAAFSPLVEFSGSRCIRGLVGFGDAPVGATCIWGHQWCHEISLSRNLFR